MNNYYNLDQFLCRVKRVYCCNFRDLRGLEGAREIALRSRIGRSCSWLDGIVCRFGFQS